MSSNWWEDLPERIAKAYALSEQLGMPLFEEGRPAGYDGPPSPCIPAVGRLLATLAASKPEGLIGEMGTACGVGCAWLASGMGANARLVSAEINPKMAATATELLQDDPRIDIRLGDWEEELTPSAPFDLLFLDAGVREQLEPANWERFTALVKVGGVMVMDDLVPLELWPPEWADRSDLKREFAFYNPQLESAEVRLTPISAALICTRVE